MNFSMKFMRPKSDARRPPVPAALVDRGGRGRKSPAGPRMSPAVPLNSHPAEGVYHAINRSIVRPRYPEWLC